MERASKEQTLYSLSIESENIVDSTSCTQPANWNQLAMAFVTKHEKLLLETLAERDFLILAPRKKWNRPSKVITGSLLLIFDAE